MKHIKLYEDWLSEKFADNHEKNIYAEITKKELEDYDVNVLDLIKTAYKDKGGHPEFDKLTDIKNTDLTFWVAKDINDNPDADIVIGGKNTSHGVKLTVMGQDGSKDAKRDVITKMITLMKTRGFYSELDPELAQKFGLPYIHDETKIRNVLNKDIEYHNDGSYSRKIAGVSKIKVLVGLPK